MDRVGGAAHGSRQPPRSEHAAEQQHAQQDEALVELHLHALGGRRGEASRLERGTRKVRRGVKKIRRSISSALAAFETRRRARLSRSVYISRSLSVRDAQRQKRRSSNTANEGRRKVEVRPKAGSVGTQGSVQLHGFGEQLIFPGDCRACRTTCERHRRVEKNVRN